MKEKIRILKVLQSLYKSSPKIEYKRLEILVNTSLFNTEKEESIWGGSLLQLLEEMKIENLITIYQGISITEKGLEYLVFNSDTE
jgi:hypothetical protein